MGLFVLLLLFLAQAATHMPVQCWPRVFTQMAAALQLIVQQTHLSGSPVVSGLTKGWDKGQTMHCLSPPDLQRSHPTWSVLSQTGASQSCSLWFTLWQMLQVPACRYLKATAGNIDKNHFTHSKTREKIEWHSKTVAHHFACVCARVTLHFHENLLIEFENHTATKENLIQFHN